MIKLVFALHRLPSLSRAEFSRYWREVHAPLVRRHAPALSIQRYVQVHALDTPLAGALRASRGGPEGHDGVAELWHFDLYRLERPDQVYELGIEEALGEAVCLIEWPDLALGLIPADRLLTIELQIVANQGRRARIEGGATWRQRIPELLVS